MGRVDLLQAFTNHPVGELGMVALTAQVAEIQVAQIGSHDVLNGIGACVVGEMAVATEDALLQTPGPARAILKHFHVMIGFEHERVGVSHPFAYQSCEMAEVRGEADVARRGAQKETNRILRVMRHVESLDGKVADLERVTGGKKIVLRFQCEDAFKPLLGVAVAVNRDVQLVGEASETTNVVAMLVGYQDGGKILRRTTNAGQTQADLARTESGIDEDARFIGFHVGAIAG